MSKSHDVLPLPPNPRAKFLLYHYSDLRDWRFFPIAIGICFAPLYDHRPWMQQAASLSVILAINWLWVRLGGVWIETRVGVTRSLRFSQMKSGIELKNSLDILKYKSTFKWQSLIIFAVMAAIVGVFSHHAAPFKPNGWIERYVSIWICMTALICINRSLDDTNLGIRRISNSIAVLLLTLGYLFIGTSPQSYAVLLVIYGATSFILGAIDLGLLLHLAATPIVRGSEEHHA